MKRLSLLDALFLYAETPETPMHIARVTIFKPESPQDDLFARFRRRGSMFCLFIAVASSRRRSASTIRPG
jgi:Wax ester synthase-like Acyl-CoA acyltransferase domain